MIENFHVPTVSSTEYPLMLVQPGFMWWYADFGITVGGAFYGGYYIEVPLKVPQDLMDIIYSFLCRDASTEESSYIYSESPEIFDYVT